MYSVGLLLFCRYWKDSLSEPCKLESQWCPWVVHLQLSHQFKSRWSNHSDERDHHTHLVRRRRRRCVGPLDFKMIYNHVCCLWKHLSEWTVIRQVISEEPSLPKVLHSCWGWINGEFLLMTEFTMFVSTPHQSQVSSFLLKFQCFLGTTANPISWQTTSTQSQLPRSSPTV